MPDDDPCKAAREALAEAARKFGSSPTPYVSKKTPDGPEENRPDEELELDEKALEAMAQLENEFLAAQAAFDDCLKKNSAAPAEA
jgi:hypothetical protein